MGAFNRQFTQVYVAFTLPKTKRLQISRILREIVQHRGDL